MYDDFKLKTNVWFPLFLQKYFQRFKGQSRLAENCVSVALLPFSHFHCMSVTCSLPHIRISNNYNKLTSNARLSSSCPLNTYCVSTLSSEDLLCGRAKINNFQILCILAFRGKNIRVKKGAHILAVHYQCPHI